jgi:4-diphosphocytidyl-2-C-methyl-D-erythritol kinase
MPDSVRLRSLAKINLDLRVLHKRPDGFHELRTIFQTISLADTIEVEYRRGGSKVELKSDMDIPGNLIVKAADLVMSALRTKGQLQIRLTKRIPMGGGLGGGSSNAASMLLALPKLLGKRVPLEKLMELGAELGSDVPFFLIGGTAVGLGRGTELYPLPDVPASPGLLLTPKIHSSTASAYASLNRQPLAEV